MCKVYQHSPLHTVTTGLIRDWNGHAADGLFEPAAPATVAAAVGTAAAVSSAVVAS